MDLVITRMSHQPAADVSKPATLHDEAARAAEVEKLKGAIKAAEAAAAEAAEEHVYTSGRLMEAEQRLIELQAAQDEVGSMQCDTVQVLLNKWEECHSDHSTNSNEISR